MASADSRPVPRKNTAFRYYLAIRKNDGTLITTWAGMDSEVSIDGGAFADCAAEATEIGTSGCGYIDLSAAEMNGDAVIYKLTVTNTSALPVVVTFFPEEAGDVRVDVVKVLGVDAVTATDVAQTGDSFARLGANGAGLTGVASIVWSETLTGATYNAPNSAGRTLRTITPDSGAIYPVAGTVTLASATSTTATLDAGASTTAQVYQWTVISILSGTGAGQSRVITNYTAGRVATVETAWTVTPNATSSFEITPTAAARVISYAAGQDPATMTWAAVSRTITGGTIGTYTGNTPQTGDAFARLGANGAGLTALGDTRLANLDATVSSRSTYAGGDTAGTTTLLSRVTASVALASQIPANFTTATFASAGVFATAALANAPTGGAAPTAAAIRAEMDSNSTRLAAVQAKTDNLPAAFPANFATLAINASGHVSRVTLVDTTTTLTIHPAYPTVGDIQSGLATAAALATVAGYIDTEVAASLAILTKLDTALVLDGAVYQFTANALELAPTAGGTAPTVGEIAAELERAAGPLDLTLAAASDKTGIVLAAGGLALVTNATTALARIVAGVNADGLVKLRADGLDAVPIEAGVNARQALSPILAACAGVLTGAGSGTIVIKGGNVATTRITTLYDADANRTSVTLNLPE